MRTTRASPLRSFFAACKQNFSTICKDENKENLPECVMIRVGDKAPNFTLKGIFQGTVSDFTIQTFPGKWLILFFYPADFTFICPTEVSGFSKMAHEFRAEDAEILGVSVDSLESHRKWAEELGGVNYPLLSDEGKTVSRLYDVLDENEGSACVRRSLSIPPTRSGI
jgi:alkyl hydroperoxide reductase subunit AhpC